MDPETLIEDFPIDFVVDLLASRLIDKYQEGEGQAIISERVIKDEETGEVFHIKTLSRCRRISQ